MIDNQNNLLPSDKALGAVIHGLASSTGGAKEALEFFDDISGKYGTEPGPSCYDAKIVALLQLRKWNDVISLVKETKEQSSVAFRGMILAPTRTSNTEAVVQIIKDTIKESSSINNNMFTRKSF